MYVPVIDMIPSIGDLPMTIRMVNVPQDYELTRTAAAAAFVIQAKTWLIEAAKEAAKEAAAAAEVAVDTERQAVSAQRLEEALKAAPSICWETLQLAAAAVQTLTAAAANAKADAEKASAEAAELKKAVLTALTLPVIDTWEEI